MGTLDDMRLFAKLAEVGNFTRAARALGVPKQTLSRRIIALEESLGVDLVLRTTRQFRLTDVGRAYAGKCAEIARLGAEANLAATQQQAQVSGTLRITADPTFGDAFLPSLLAPYMSQHPAVQIQVVLTSRRIDLVEEGFDIAFRVGRLEDSSLIARKLAPAAICYVAAPKYFRRRGMPTTPAELATHDVIELAPGARNTRWPFQVEGELTTVKMNGRLRVNSLAMAKEAALAGLGITNLPTFACANELRSRRLKRLLVNHTPDVGGVFLVYPQNRYLAARVRAFVDTTLPKASHALAAASQPDC